MSSMLVLVSMPLQAAATDSAPIWGGVTSGCRIPDSTEYTGSQPTMVTTSAVRFAGP